MPVCTAEESVFLMGRIDNRARPGSGIALIGRASFVAMALFFALALSWGQNTGTSNPPPVDKRDSWSVAFCTLQGVSLPPEESYLAYSVPLLLQDLVSSVSTHAYSDTELTAYKKSVVDGELRNASQVLLQARKQRDELALGAQPDPKALDAADKKVTAASQRVLWLEGLDPSVVDVKREKPLVIKQGTGVGNLFGAPAYSQYDFAVSSAVDVDLLVGGTVRVVQGYVVLDLWAYQVDQQEITFSFRDAAPPESIYASLSEASTGLVGTLLGREWSALTVIPDPPGSEVFIDGVSYGQGTVQTEYVKPGRRTVKTTAPGYREDVRELDLDPGEQRTEAVHLAKIERPTITVSSAPPGADVYLNSVWIGKTPLTLEAPADRQRLQLALDGFYGLSSSLDEHAADMSFALQKEAGSLDTIQKKARNDFYVAFGFLALSFPAPFVLLNLANDAASAATRSANAGFADQGLLTSYNAYSVSYYGSLALVVSLAVWTVWEAVIYVGSADRTAG